MARSPRVAVVMLLAGGVVLCLAGAISVGIGLLNPELISDQLPPDAAVDAPAVGGAAVALGVGVIVVALLHVAIAAALVRRVGVAATAGVVLAATMAALSFGFAVAALVSIASGSAPAGIMVPASIGLVGAVIGYGAAASRIIGSRTPPI